MKARRERERKGTLSEQGVGGSLLGELEEGRATGHAGHLVLHQGTVSNTAKLGKLGTQVLHGGAEGQVANEEGRSRFHLSS